MGGLKRASKNGETLNTCLRSVLVWSDTVPSSGKGHRVYCYEGELAFEPGSEKSESLKVIRSTIIIELS